MHFLSGFDHHLACLGTFLVRLTPFPAAIACRDLVFVFGPCGSNRIFIKSGSQAQGASLGIQLGHPSPRHFCAHEKVSHIAQEPWIIYRNPGNPGTPGISAAAGAAGGGVSPGSARAPEIPRK